MFPAGLLLTFEYIRFFLKKIYLKITSEMGIILDYLLGVFDHLYFSAHFSIFSFIMDIFSFTLSLLIVVPIKSLSANYKGQDNLRFSLY